MPVINGTAGNDTLIGGDDGFEGNEGSDVINGLGGDDVLDGRGGQNVLNGGDGNDRFLLSMVNTKLANIDGGQGFDTLDMSNAPLFTAYRMSVADGQFRFEYYPIFDGTIGSNAPRIFQNGLITSIESFKLTSLNDSFTIEKGVGVSVYGGEGSDSLTSTSSAPFHFVSSVSLYGEAGDDTLAGGNNDRLYGGAGDDSVRILDRLGQVRGEIETVFASGGDGIDTLVLSVLYGPFDLASGSATLTPPQAESLGRYSLQFEGFENVVIPGGEAFGDGGANRLSTGGAAATLHGRAGNDTLVGGGAADALYGDDGADSLVGGAGNDRLYGGSGNDTLVGEAGNNLLDGGAGIDTAVFGYSTQAARFAYAPGVIDIFGPANQIDRTTGIERYQFTDRTIELNDGAPAVDDLYYLLLNKDVAATSLDADFHYNQQGWREGRDPNVFFDTSAYLSANRDIANAGINPLAHFLAAGWREGRDPAWFFDNEQYLADNPDAVGSGLSPLEHALAIGLFEGRLVRPAIGTVNDVGFDLQYYLFRNEDVGRSGADPYAHFLAGGWRDYRDPNAYFDTAYYLNKNPDVALAGVNPLLHYMQAGWREGRDPSAQFDTSSYLAANPDVAAAGINPLLHYLIAGRLEGRGFGAASPAAAPAAAEVSSWEAAPAESDLLFGLSTLLGAHDDGSSQPYVMVDAGDVARAEQQVLSSDGIDTLI